MRRWLIAFLFTQAVEVPIYVFALRRSVSEPAKRFGVAFLASLVTHPVVWFGFPRLVTHTYQGMVVAAEIFAIVVEGLILSGFFVPRSLPRAFAWSFAVNLTSVSLGLASRYLLGFP